MKHHLRWLVVPILVAALTVVGCSGDEDDGASADTTPASTGSAAAPASTAATETSTPASGNEVGNLAELTAGFESATFSAAYVVDASSDDEALAGTWQWTQDGATDRLRFDIESDGETVIMITTPDGVTFCADGACFSMDAANAMFPDLGGMLTGEVDAIADEAADGTVTAAPSQTIAGVEAECYDFEDATEDASGTICYSPEGVPLLIDARSADGDFRLTADSYSTSVAEADFDPPFPVTPFPGAGN